MASRCIYEERYSRDESFVVTGNCNRMLLHRAISHPLTRDSQTSLVAKKISGFEGRASRVPVAWCQNRVVRSPVSYLVFDLLFSRYTDVLIAVACLLARLLREKKGFEERELRETRLVIHELRWFKDLRSLRENDYQGFAGIVVIWSLCRGSCSKCVARNFNYSRKSFEVRKVWETLYSLYFNKV